MAVADKSNEITAVPALLELLDIKDAVVSPDATPGGALPEGHRRGDPPGQPPVGAVLRLGVQRCVPCLALVALALDL